MQSTAIFHSSGVRLPLPRRNWAHHHNPKFNPRFTLTSTFTDSSSSIKSSPGWIYPKSHRPIKPSPPLPPHFTSVPSAAAAAADNDQPQESKKFADTLVLAALFAFWIIFNIYFNIYNKQVLKVYQFPITVTTAQFAVGSLLVTLMWTLNLYKRPKITGAQLVAILPLAIAHTLGNVFTNVSLGKVSVSFTHTIKAMEPFFSVLLSAMFLGEMPTIWIVISLLPIVGGVGFASLLRLLLIGVGFGVQWLQT